MISVPSPAGPKFVTTAHFQPLKMQRDAVEDLFGRRHRSHRAADQKLQSKGASTTPRRFTEYNQHTTINMEGDGDIVGGGVLSFERF